MDGVEAPEGAKEARQNGGVAPAAVTEVFVVQGTCGEYSDRTDWIVRAFDSEPAAQAFAEQCKREGMECYAKRANVMYPAKYDIMPESDPNYRDDYTGPPDYTVYSCPFTATSPPQ